MTPNRKLFFVIVHWGDENLTKRAILSVKKNIQISKDCLIVVANGANFQSENYDVTILSLKENNGYAAGVNAGICLAIEKGASHILVMNNDLEYQPGAAEALIVGTESGLDCVGGTVREEHSLPVRGGGHLSWFRGRTLPNFREEKMDYVSGAFFLISRECFENVGPMPEKYFHTWEDVAYSFLISKKGFQIGYVATPEIPHLCSQSMGKSRIKTYYLVRNGSMFVREFCPLFFKQWLIGIEQLRLLWAILRRRWEIVYALLDARKGVSGKINPLVDLTRRPKSL